MKKRLNVVGILILSVFAISATGCSAKAKPIHNTSFVKASVMAEDPTLPYHKVWVSPEFDKDLYNQLYIVDVDTDHMIGLTEWQEGFRKKELKADVEQVAVYAKEAFKKAFREDPEHRFKIVNLSTRQSGTLILEMALTEVVPSKVVLNTLGYAPFGIGLGIKTLRKLSGDMSTVALEARGRDAATGKILFMISDRMTQQTAIVSTKDFTWYSHAYGIIDEMAKKLVAVANREKGAEVKDTSGFTLKAW